MSGFHMAARAFAVLALATGAADVVVGLSGQQLIGAALNEGYGDPLLNSQIRYLGAIWMGFGALLWHCLGDVSRYASILKGAFAVVFIGGLGRLVTVVQFGLPESSLGTVFVWVAILIEIVGMPLLWLGLKPRPGAWRGQR